MGGMRYQYKWSDVDPNEIPKEQQENLEATIRKGLEAGMNHIETARGYGSSEIQLGRFLPGLERDKMIVQTKVAPCEDPQEFRAAFETSMQNLGLDYVDLFSIHGINNAELLDMTLRKGGCMEVAREFQRDGRVRFIGFSTHATEPVITRAIQSGEFDYVNLHWYFVNDLNWRSVEEAKRLDVGMFIISPADKGGKLYEPPQKMVDLCQPLTPMQFNDLYCLARPEVHTLSIGAAKPEDFDEHVAALEYYDNIEATIAPIEARLRATMKQTLGEDWYAHWNEGLPDYHDLPGQVNVVEILRLWNYATSLDLVEWGKMRYNLLGNGGHWFPGENIKAFPEADLLPHLAASPFADRIPGVLRQAHELMFGEEKKRLSQSD
jgi:predicted aldo/keto reductase-like oxidoreductase